MEERDIIALILHGNTNAFASLVEKYQDMAFSIAFKMLRNKEDAEEVVQDAFVKAYKALPSFRGEARFSTWFYRILYHTSVSRYQGQFLTSLREETLDYIDEIPEENEELNHMEITERTAIIQAILRHMPPDEELLLTLYYLEECSINEIVQITGLSESNVKVKLFRARKRFYDLLKKYMKNEINVLQ